MKLSKHREIEREKIVSIKERKKKNEAQQRKIVNK